MTGEPIDPRTFRHVLGQFCTGITIITTMHDDVPNGFACQSFAALSLEPPLVLFCPTRVSRSWQAIEASGKPCVDVLTESRRGTCARFRSKEPDSSPASTGAGQARFAGAGQLAGAHRLDRAVGARRWRSLRRVRAGALAVGGAQGRAAAVAVLPRRVHRHQARQNTPAQWRDDLESFLTATTNDAWLWPLWDRSSARTPHPDPPRAGAAAVCSPMRVDDRRGHLAVHGLVQDVVARIVERPYPDRRDLVGVGAHPADRGDRIVLAVYGQRRYGQAGQFGAEAVQARSSARVSAVPSASTKASGSFSSESM